MLGFHRLRATGHLHLLYIKTPVPICMTMMITCTMYVRFVCHICQYNKHTLWPPCGLDVLLNILRKDKHLYNDRLCHSNEQIKCNVDILIRS